MVPCRYRCILGRFIYRGSRAPITLGGGYLTVTVLMADLFNAIRAVWEIHGVFVAYRNGIPLPPAPTFTP